MYMSAHPCMCPQLHVCQCVWPYVPMPFDILVNISELIGKCTYVYLHVCAGVSSLVQARISFVCACTYISGWMCLHDVLEVYWSVCV